MSDASGDGAAYDATARVDQGRVDELTARLAALNELSPEEQARIDERAAAGRELHEELRQIEGSREHAAHRAQLVRLYREALAALDTTDAALVKAEQHVIDKRNAVADAQDALVRIQQLCESEGVNVDGME